jgi:hypothetical protein
LEKSNPFFSNDWKSRRRFENETIFHFVLRRGAVNVPAFRAWQAQEWLQLCPSKMTSRI